MAIIEFWITSRATVLGLSIEQVVSMAGDGNLRDGSPCSDELRGFLSLVPAEKLSAYIDQCLAKTTKNWSPKGLVLQDIINELGRRLEYGVQHGRYQGVSGEIGFDGLWFGEGQDAIVVEAKTSDGFPIDLETVADYRKKLIATGTIAESSSMLMVVGASHTGNLEAQIRGSRWAWDTRMISVQALAKLVILKEHAGPATLGQIHALLRPVEYTRLDALIDIVFTAAKEVEEAASTDAVNEEGGQAVSSSGFTATAELDSKRAQIIAAMSAKIDRQLLKRTRALYWDHSRTVRVACTISKRYDLLEKYWYAYHPNMDAFLAEAVEGYYVLGAMDMNVAFALPLAEIRALLEVLNTTEKADGKTYWHVKIVEPKPGRYELLVPRGKNVDLTAFTLKLA